MSLKLTNMETELTEDCFCWVTNPITGILEQLLQCKSDRCKLIQGKLKKTVILSEEDQS
jgi:hypothetical protein